MRQVNNGDVFLSYRKSRRQRVLQKMAAMRAAKERKRLERPAPEPEPKRQRWHRFEFAVRDKLTGQTAWHDLKSVRHAATACRLILRHYV
jgi:hypothetical protein